MERTKNRNVVAAQCRRLRNKLGWTQDELVARCQRMGWVISRATLAKIEGGYRRVNDAEVALLARALQTAPNDLLALPVAQLLESARQGSGLEQDLMAADEAE